MAATEAVLLGKPVVTTNVCGAKELLGDGEYGIVTENSEEALLDGLRRMLPGGDPPALRLQGRGTGGFVLPGRPDKADRGAVFRAYCRAGWIKGLQF